MMIGAVPSNAVACMNWSISTELRGVGANVSQCPFDSLRGRQVVVYHRKVARLGISRSRLRRSADPSKGKINLTVEARAGSGHSESIKSVSREGKSSTHRQAIAAEAASDLGDAAAMVHHAPAVMVNSATGKMGRAVAEALVGAGVALVPFSIAGEPVIGDGVVDVKGVHIQLRYKSEREALLDEVLKAYPDVILVDYTIPPAVNDNAEFYCRRGVPFVMGTTGGDRAKLMNGVLKSGNYAVIAPQMGKQVVAFQAAMQVMAEQFPGAFSGYKLQVTESHQSSKMDTSGTAKAVVGSFAKLGLDFDVDQIEMVRDPQEQMQRMKVPEQHLLGHAYHTYRVLSPDNTVSFEFQHNVCGRSIYAEGTVDAVLFLAKKIKQKSEKKVYDMIDVLREGSMR